MIGHIYITGTIGSTKEEKGVELMDVIDQFTKAGECDQYNIWIKSPGGFVDVGNKIAEYIQTKKNVFTIADEYCASIATRIHVAVPVENRMITKGSSYLIHCPLLDGISGNSDELKAASEYLKPIENELLKVYTKATKQPKETISLLMKQETVFTDEQCVSMGFASKIIPKQFNFKAVAYSNNNQITNDEMSWKEKYEKAKAAMQDFFKDESGTPPARAHKTEGRTAVAMKVTSDKGELETPYEDGILPMDPITDAEGNALEAGDYTLEDGTILVVMADEMGSWVAEVKNAPEPAATTDAETIAALQKENEELKAERDEMSTAIEDLTAKSELLAKKVTGSSYVPPASATAYRPVAGAGKKPETAITSQEMRDRRAEYKSKNK